MQSVIHQLRVEQLQIHRLLYGAAAALHRSDRVTFRSQVRQLRELLLGHLAFGRSVLSGVAKLDELNGRPEQAQRTRDFVAFSMTTETQLEDMVVALEQAKDLREADLSWSASRLTIESLIDQEQKVLQQHGANGTTDRREALRVACAVPALIVGENPVEGRVKDLSLSGVRVELDDPLPEVGQRVELHVSLQPARPPVQVAARIRWQGNAEYLGARRTVGLRFDEELPPISGLMLAQWVAFEASRSGFITG